MASTEQDDEGFDEECGGRASLQLPVNPEQLVIRDLNTGDLYKVGENEPEFDYNTWPITVGDDEKPDSDSDNRTSSTGNNIKTTTKDTTSKSSPGYLTRMYRWLFGRTKDGEGRVTLSDKSRQRNDEKKERTQYSKLNNFKFRRKLGEGAFGRVLLAESIADGKLYAMKIMEKKGMRSSDRKQAQAERNILLAMSRSDNMHPFTTGLKFAFQSEKRLYLGMDYLPGGTLKNLLQTFGYLPENWVRFFAAELVLAISHIHSMNVLYRDIKPHNVMIDGRGHLVLIDYGLSKAKVTDPAAGAMSLVGTPDYSAPEVLRTGAVRLANRKGRKSSDTKAIGYGQAADWWSLGIMIYEMLQGKPPFRGRDLRQTYKNVLFAKLSFPEFPVSNVSRSLGELQPDDVDPLLQRTGRDSTTITTNNNEKEKEKKKKKDTDSESKSDTTTTTTTTTTTSNNKEGKGEKGEKVEEIDIESLIIPSSHFSKDSQRALLGFLSREPSSRLGYPQMRDSSSSTEKEKERPSTSNSRNSKIERNLAALPTDIKNCSFFASYTDDDWGALYSRSVNGPWVPEPDPLIVRKESRAKQANGGGRTTSTASVNNSGDLRDPEGMALVKEACKHAEEYGEYERKLMKSMHDEIQALSSHVDMDADITNGTIDSDTNTSNIDKGEDVNSPIKSKDVTTNGTNGTNINGDAITPTGNATHGGDNVLSPSPGEKFTGFEFVSSPPLNHRGSAVNTPNTTSKTPVELTKPSNSTTTTTNVGATTTAGSNKGNTKATSNGISTNDVNLEHSGPKSYFNFESDLLSTRMDPGSVGPTTKENKLMDWSFVADKNILGLDQSNMNAIVTASVVNQGITDVGTNNVSATATNTVGNANANANAVGNGGHGVKGKSHNGHKKNKKKKGKK